MTQFSELHDASSKRWTQLSSFRALVFLLLTQNCAGRIEVVGPSQPVVAMVGDDVVLTCRLEPAADASDMSVEWYREDLDPRYVFVWWDGEELEDSKHPAYKGRTSLLVNKLELGDVSLKLSKVKVSDGGKYTCFIPRVGQGSTVELVVGIVSFTVIIMAVVFAAVIILFISAVVLFVHTRRQNRKQRNLLSDKEQDIEQMEKKYVDINNKLKQRKQENETLNSRLEELLDEKEELMDEKESLMDEKKLLMDEKLKWMETERKLKTEIQNKIEELDGMKFDTNSDPTGSEVRNQVEESEKLQDEKNKWMETVGNLRKDLDIMNQKLTLTGPITLVGVHKWGDYIRLKNISTEEIKLEGWKLELQKNYSTSLTYTFYESLELKAGGILSLRSPYCYSEHPYDVGLEWSDMMSWTPSDQQQINLISNSGDEFNLL